MQKLDARDAMAAPCQRPATGLDRDFLNHPRDVQNTASRALRNYWTSARSGSVAPPLGVRGLLVGLRLEHQRDVDQLVLLAADQLATPGLEQDLRARDAVPLRGVARVLEERGV